MFNFKRWLIGGEDLSKLKPLNRSVSFIAFPDGKIFYAQENCNTHDMIWHYCGAGEYAQKNQFVPSITSRSWPEMVIRGRTKNEEGTRIVEFYNDKNKQSLPKILQTLLKDNYISLKSKIRTNSIPDGMLIDKFLKNTPPNEENTENQPEDMEARKQTMDQVRKQFKTDREYQEFLRKMRAKRPSASQLPPSRDPSEIIKRTQKGIDPYGY